MRALIAAAVTVFLASVPTLGYALTTTPGVLHQEPAVYRFTIGDARVTALSDGTIPIDLHKVMKGPTSAEIDALLARGFLVNPVQPSINCYLVEMRGRMILIDTGAGDLFGPGNGGQLLEALKGAGVLPQQINDVLITHVHPDHIGGLVRNGLTMFPEANVHVGKADLDSYFGQRGSRDDKHLSALVTAMFKPYIDAGMVRSFEQDGEIVPGISAELRPGHTPGNAIFRLASQGQEIVFIGDTVHVAAVQFYRPDVTFIFDQDPIKARADREKAFHEFSRTATLIAAPHISFPGVGYMRADGEAFHWVPVEYANRAPNSPEPKL